MPWVLYVCLMGLVGLGWGDSISWYVGAGDEGRVLYWCGRVDKDIVWLSKASSMVWKGLSR